MPVSRHQRFAREAVADQLWPAAGQHDAWRCGVGRVPPVPLFYDANDVERNRSQARLRLAAMPTRPMPRRTAVPGSGIGRGVPTTMPSAP